MIPRPHYAIPIQDCGEPLVAIPLDQIAVVQPHPYGSLNAPYGDRSPYYLRAGVLAALIQAQHCLATQRPGWRIQVFDAYRPLAVQQFMVEYTLQEVLHRWGWQGIALSERQQAQAQAEVEQFWAPPSPHPQTPPPHSTGAAIDVTLIDGQGQPVCMGSPIDEVSPRSFPDHFASSEDPAAQQWHRDRTLLHDVMRSAGFRRHPHEWWHFSLGDQLWAWLVRQETGDNTAIARYGRVEEPSAIAPPPTAPYL